MSKILFGMLIAWLVTSCNIEEPNNSGVLVDSSSDIEIPEGLTARDFDHNNDGIVDILDLVIASKFMGQEVSNRNQVISAGGGDEYVYKVLGCRTHFAGQNRRNAGIQSSIYSGENIELGYLSAYRGIGRASFAFRFHVASDSNIIEVKVKPIEENPLVKQSMTHRLDTFPSGISNNHADKKRGVASVSRIGEDHNGYRDGDYIFDYFAKGLVAYSKVTSDAGGELGQVFVDIKYYTNIDDKRLYENRHAGAKVSSFLQYEDLIEGRNWPIQIGRIVGRNAVDGVSIKSGRIVRVYLTTIRADEEIVPYEKIKLINSRSIITSAYERETKLTWEEYRLKESKNNPAEWQKKADIERILANSFSYECFDTLLPGQHTKGSLEGLISTEVRAKYFPEDIE